MKKIIILVFIVSMSYSQETVLTKSNVASSTMDSLAMYYPLHIGNMWQHIRSGHVGADGYTDTVTTRIAGDTVISGKLYAVAENTHRRAPPYIVGSYFARFDPVTGNYYELLPGSTKEVLLDSVAANTPGTYSWGTLSIAYHQGPLGLDATVRKIERTGTVQEGHYCAWGIGKYNVYATGPRFGYASTLRYAQIGGKEYGSMIANTVEVAGIRSIDRFALEQNYPNPFNPTTVVSCQLPVAGFLRLAVYDLLGREVQVLTDGFSLAGTFRFEFDGAKLSSGVYICRMMAGDFVSTKKMTVLR